MRFNNISYEQLVVLISNAVSQSIKPLETQVQDMKATVSTQSQKIDDLATDRVKREDLEQLKKEMREGFNGVYSREMVDRFQEDTKEEIKNIKDILRKQSGQPRRILSNMGTIFAILACLISIIGVLAEHWR